MYGSTGFILRLMSLIFWLLGHWARCGQAGRSKDFPVLPSCTGSSVGLAEVEQGTGSGDGEQGGGLESEAGVCS